LKGLALLGSSSQLGFASSFNGFVILGVTLVPVVIDQLIQLLKGVPGWLENSQENLHRLDKWAQARRLPINLSGISNQINTRIYGQVQAVATLWIRFGTLTGLLDLVLVIVLAFYMLLYGDRMWRGLISILPPQIGVSYKRFFTAEFPKLFISQLLLGLFMVITLTPIFLFFHVSYPLLFAVLIGRRLIPYWSDSGYWSSDNFGSVSELAVSTDSGSCCCCYAAN
jgi:predicted PurR-regulated permease PerM